MNLLQKAPMTEIASRHSKTPKTIGFTMVLEPYRIRETRKLKNPRAFEENPKGILTRVRVHISYINDDILGTVFEFRRFCLKTENAIKLLEKCKSS